MFTERRARLLRGTLRGFVAQSSTHTIAKFIEKTRPTVCQVFENLRLGAINLFCNNMANFMLPKRRFWKDEQQMKCGFSNSFSMVSSPKRVLTPLKSASKIHISSFVTFQWSKIVVWEHKMTNPVFTPLDIENAHLKSVKSTVRSFTLRSSNFNHCEMVKDLMSSNVSCDMFALVAHT